MQDTNYTSNTFLGNTPFMSEMPGNTYTDRLPKEITGRQVKMYGEFDMFDAHLQITGVKHTDEQNPMMYLYAELHGMDIMTFTAYKEAAQYDPVLGLFEPVDCTEEERMYVHKLNVTVPMLHVALFEHAKRG